MNRNRCLCAAFFFFSLLLFSFFFGRFKNKALSLFASYGTELSLSATSFSTLLLYIHHVVGVSVAANKRINKINSVFSLSYWFSIKIIDFDSNRKQLSTWKSDNWLFYSSRIEFNLFFFCSGSFWFLLHRIELRFVLGPQLKTVQKLIKIIFCLKFSFSPRLTFAFFARKVFKS